MKNGSNWLDVPVRAASGPALQGASVVVVVAGRGALALRVGIGRVAARADTRRNVGRRHRARVEMLRLQFRAATAELHHAVGLTLGPDLSF